MAEKQWNLGVGYDRRFGHVAFQLRHGTDTPIRFLIPVADLIRNCEITRGELADYLKDAESGIATLTGDIEPIRRKVIENQDMKGKVVLDIGGYDGWAAKMALDQGASKAICLDNHQYDHYGWADKKLEGVDYLRGDFMDWPNIPDGCYVDRDFDTLQPDIIIFYNVLYHLKNPWAGLYKVREIIKPDGVMLLSTLFRYHDDAWMYVYEPRECNPGDETVYFGPSITALEKLLTATGWEFTQTGKAMDRVVYVCKPKEGWQRRHQDS